MSEASRDDRAAVGRPTRVACAAAATLLLATPAAAAGGEIVLAPELIKLVPMVVLFLLLVFPVNALLFRPILAALDARAEKTEGMRERTRKLAAEAEQLLGRYEREVAEARATAEQARREAVSQARAELQAQAREARAVVENEIDQARGRVAGELAQAREALKSEARELAREAASRVLGRPLS